MSKFLWKLRKWLFSPSVSLSSSACRCKILSLQRKMLKIICVFIHLSKTHEKGGNKSGIEGSFVFSSNMTTTIVCAGIIRNSQPVLICQHWRHGRLSLFRVVLIFFTLLWCSKRCWGSIRCCFCYYTQLHAWINTYLHIYTHVWMTTYMNTGRQKPSQTVCLAWFLSACLAMKSPTKVVTTLVIA